jgi:hypothetical protein
MFLGLQVCYETSRGGGGTRRYMEIAVSQNPIYDPLSPALNGFLKCIQFIVINGVSLQMRYPYCTQ